MKNQYMVTADCTISLHVTVYATSRAEAKRKASQFPVMSLCHQCASGVVGCEGEEWVTSGELDGELRNLRVEEGGT